MVEQKSKKVKTIKVNIELEDNKAIKQIEELMEHLNAANLLANKLAATLDDLKLNVQI